MASFWRASFSPAPGGWLLSGDGGGGVGVRLIELTLEFPLMFSELGGLAGDVVHALTCLLATHLAERIARLLHAVGCAAGALAAGLLSLAHVVEGAVELVAGVAEARIGGLAGALARERFHLASQLLGFAPQHFLGPALFEVLLALRLAGGQLLLTAGEFFELFEGFIHLALAFARFGRRLCGFVLVFLGVELEVEEAFEIAALTTGATAATTLAEGDLDLTEGALGAQQVLQGALLRRQRVAPALGFQQRARFEHVARGFVHLA